MISNPDQYVDDFAKAGADIIAVHVEVQGHLHRTIQQIKDAGVRAAAVLNPATSLDTIEYIIEDLDMVLIMSVNPGFGGQKFIKGVLPKIEQLRKMIDDGGLDIEIEVDGGVNPETINMVSSAGANVFVAGSAIFNTDDYAKTIRILRNNM